MSGLEPDFVPKAGTFCMNSGRTFGVPLLNIVVNMDLVESMNPT